MDNQKFVSLSPEFRPIPNQSGNIGMPEVETAIERMAIAGASFDDMMTWGKEFAKELDLSPLAISDLCIICYARKKLSVEIPEPMATERKMAEIKLVCAEMKKQFSIIERAMAEIARLKTIVEPGIKEKTVTSAEKIDRDMKRIENLLKKLDGNVMERDVYKKLHFSIEYLRELTTMMLRAGTIVIETAPVGRNKRVLTLTSRANADV